MFLKIKNSLAQIQISRFWLILAGALFVFFLLPPVTGDDATFTAFHNSTDLMSASHYMYQELNGRILGNAFAFIFAGHLFLTALIKTVLVLVIFSILCDLLKIKPGTIRNFMVASMLTIPVVIFHETYAWRAGFYNYVVPVAILLLVVWLFIRLPSANRNKLLAAFGYVAILVLSFCAGLFTENITLGWVVISAIVLFVSLIKYRKSILGSLSIFIGSISGAYLMLSSPIYSELAKTGGDNYRDISLSLSGIIHIAKDNAVMYSSLLISSYTLVYLALSFLACFILYKNKLVTPKSITKFISTQKLQSCFYALFVAVPIYFMISNNFYSLKYNISDHFYSIYALGDLVITFIYLLALAYVFFTSIKDQNTRQWSAVLLIAAMLLTGVLLIVSPFGGRNFYVSYIFIIAVIACVSNYVLGPIIKKHEAILRKISYFIFISLAIIYFSIFAAINIRYNQNLNAVEQQKNNSKVITLKKYPFSEFTQDSTNKEKSRLLYAECTTMYRQYKNCLDFTINYK